MSRLSFTPSQKTGHWRLGDPRMVGLNPQIKGMTDRLAKDGFVALAPDLYHGDLATHQEFDKAERLMNQHLPQQAAKDMNVAIDFLSQSEYITNPAIGVIGFCMGGMLSFMIAANRGDVVKAVVPFYGFPQGEGEPDWRQMQAVVRGHMAKNDDYFSSEAAKKLEEKLLSMGKDVHFHFHEAGHAFMNEENPLNTYDPEISKKTWSDMVSFLKKTLG